MKPRFVVRREADSLLLPTWGIFDLTVHAIIETYPTRKDARGRAHELNSLHNEWKSEQEKAAE